MLYITGDTHGDFSRIFTFCKNSELEPQRDNLIILGDAGINYSGDERDIFLKNQLARLPITLFCIHGNHEMRPEGITSYEKSTFSGGTVYVEAAYPNILFAKDGEIYDLCGSKAIVIGGAYSVDKFYRIARGLRWFEDEQPSQEIRERVEDRLKSVDWEIDTVLSHTCPLKYEPTEMFLKGINQSVVDKSTEKWLDTLENRLKYNRWMCGHYHTEKRIDKLIFLYKSILTLSDLG